MISSQNLFAKIPNAMRVFFLACALAIVPMSQVSASDALEDCLEPECVEAAKSRAVLHRIFRASEEPVLHFLANKNAETAASLLANPSTLKGNPLLALLAINAIATPTPEQRAVIRTVATDHAVLQLTLLPSASTPDERDEILKDALTAKNWSEGYTEIAHLVYKALATLDLETITALTDQETTTLWLTANADEQKIIEETLAHVTAMSIAVAEMPTFHNITSICKELRLLETIHRRGLCKELGQKMEQRSNALITVLIGLVIQKYAADDALQVEQIETRTSTWSEFPKLALEALLDADNENLPILERAKVELKVSTLFAEHGEIPALIKLYEQHPQADEAVLALIRAVRAKR